MNNPLTILSPEGTPIYLTPVNNGCRRRIALMSEDYILVKFSDKNKIEFPIGCSIENFYLTTPANCKWNVNTGGYDYELKFDAHYYRWSLKILRYITPGVKDAPYETSFKLTATIDVHAEIILRALNDAGFQFNGSQFRVDTTDPSLSSEAKYIYYENQSILGGIEAIAEAFECEWWIEDNVIYLGRCENGVSLNLTVGKEIESVSPSTQEIQPNRLYLFGSDKNLPPNYRTVASNETATGIVNRRLMLPEGFPYLQTRANIPENEIVEKVIVLEKIYPKTSLEITDVSSYQSEGEDNGQPVTETFYRIRYGEDFKFSEDYILPNEELHLTFESGLLNGMDFSIRFNPLGYNERNSDGSFNQEAQMFEIIVNQDYGRKLPDEILFPKVGDKFSIYNWDATKMESLGLVEAAEKSLLEEGEKLLEEYRKDMSTYTCPMMWDWCKEQKENRCSPKLGSLINLHFSPLDGGRMSRIIAIEYDADIEYANVVFTLGEKVSVSRLKTLENKVEGLTRQGEIAKTINSLDFLSKRYSDRTPFGLSVGGLLKSEDLATFGDFLSGMFGGFGGAVDNKGNAEFESLRVRSFMEILELIVNRMTTIEGDQIFTEGDTIESVQVNTDGTYTLKLREKWEGYKTSQIENNVLRGIYNNISNSVSGAGTSTIHGATYYTSWMLVLSADQSANTLRVAIYNDEDTPAGRNFPPVEMMNIARWGNAGSAENERYRQRQTTFLISSSEGRILKYINVTKPIIDKGNVALSIGDVPEFLIGLNEDIKKGDQVFYSQKSITSQNIRIDYQGRPVSTDVFRGDWDENSIYYDGTEFVEDSIGGPCYERSIVRRFGCLWICDINHTQTPPMFGGTAWIFHEGIDTMRLEFDTTQDSVWVDNPEISLGVICHIGNHDFTKDGVIRYDWSRQSWHEDDQDTLSDSLWNTAHSNIGPSVILHEEDFNYSFGAPPDKLLFTVTATLLDATGRPATDRNGNNYSDTLSFDVSPD